MLALAVEKRRKQRWDGDEIRAHRKGKLSTWNGLITGPDRARLRYGTFYILPQVLDRMGHDADDFFSI
jgi:hypothetical protein